MLRASIAGLFLFAFVSVAQGGETIRIATFNTELSRDGPGILLRDIQRRTDDVMATVDTIARTSPDLIALQSIDWDYENRAIQALADLLAENGAAYPHIYAPPTNRGLMADQDLDGDGKPGGPGDAHGFGAFSGHSAMAVLSRFPIDTAEIQQFDDLVWKDLPKATLPTHPDGSPFPSSAALERQRLSSSGHWVLPVALPNGVTLTLMTFHATPPVFDGPEDRNGLRNHDEIAFWTWFLDGLMGPGPIAPFVLAGNANLDPFDSDGRHAAIRSLIAHPALQDTQPASPVAAGLPDQGHAGDSALDTVDWQGAGRLRVSYVLPSADLTVVDAGVDWSESATTDDSSRHRLVWVDIAVP